MLGMFDLDILMKYKKWSITRYVTVDYFTHKHFFNNMNVTLFPCYFSVLSDGYIWFVPGLVS